MTTISTATFEAASWVPLPNPYRAVMRASVAVQGDTDTVIPDLVQALARELPAWAVVGETLIAVDSAPTGQLPEDAAEHVAGGFVFSLDPNQGAPSWSQGNPEPDTADVRVVIEQPMTHDVDDLTVYIQRRRDLRSVLHRLHGNIG